MIMLTVFFSILGVIGVLVLRKKAIAPLSQVDREYLRFCQLLAKQGLSRHLGEGPLDFCARVSSERPDLSAAASEVTGAYIKQNYVEDDPADVKELRKAVRAFRVRSLTAS